MTNISKFCLAIGIALSIFDFSFAQQTNPNNLPPCQGINISKWTNCFGADSIPNAYNYVGDYLNGKHHGFGILHITLQETNGDRYIGGFGNGTYNGRGTYTHRSGEIYDGDYKDGLMHGRGTYTFPNGDKYVGEFKDGQYHGQGKVTTVNGVQFSGIWENGKYIRELKKSDSGFSNAKINDHSEDGWKRLAGDTFPPDNPNKLSLCDAKFNQPRNNCWGTSTTESGAIYVGEYNNDSYHGVGSYTYRNGDKYYGDFKYGKPNGIGSYIFSNGSKYKGEMKDGFRDGFGEHIHQNGSKYIGYWKKSQFHGQGIVTALDGSQLEGIFENGKFIREAKVSLPSLPSSISVNNATDNVERERQQLAEERRRLEAEKRQREQQRQSQRINLKVTHTQPDADGAVTINVQTNADTASLLINNEEQGGRSDGNYVIKKTARVGQDTQFKITATDINDNSETKTITVTRQAVPSSTTQVTALKPETINRSKPRDAVAIIIGIQNYKRVPNAEFANNDAREFSEYAIRALGIKPEKIKMLLDDEADEVNIVKAFENWLPIQVNKDKTDVYVFYSGHGLPAPDGKSLYFLPHGVDKELLSRTAVAQNEIVAALTNAKPKSVTMFIDACYSGQTRGGDVLVANAKPVALKADKNAYPANFTVITASANDQISSSSSELKHGIFSFFLMKGMEGEADANKDGKITVGEMQDYLSDKVARQATTLGRKQNTQMVGDSSRVLVGR